MEYRILEWNNRMECWNQKLEWHLLQSVDTTKTVYSIGLYLMAVHHAVLECNNETEFGMNIFLQQFDINSLLLFNITYYLFILILFIITI